MVQNSDGFTVVELCIAVMIVDMLAAFSSPHFTGFMRVYRLNGAARVVWGDVHKARLMAIKENRTVRVDFTNTSYTIVRVDTAEVAFSRNLAVDYPGVTLSAAPTLVAFASSGMLASATGTVQILNPTGTKSFTVLTTGRIGSIS